jgi:hypothetical protein
MPPLDGAPPLTSAAPPVPTPPPYPDAPLTPGSLEPELHAAALKKEAEPRSASAPKRTRRSILNCRLVVKDRAELFRPPASRADALYIRRALKDEVCRRRKWRVVIDANASRCRREALNTQSQIFASHSELKLSLALK